MVIEDDEFIEEGFIRRKLKLENGELVEVWRTLPSFNDRITGLVRGTKTGNLYNKWELK